MYLPKSFEESDIKTLHELIRARPLATLVTLSSDGLNANHIPLHLSTDPAPFGTLRGHVARANPMWQDLRHEVEVLAIFHGPDAYISPSWYATKKEHGKVVPTWNYSTVHAYGTLKVMDDADWVRTQMESITQQSETRFSTPWTLDEAPQEYRNSMMRAVVGIEIVMTRLIGKWKVSQNQPMPNQLRVIEGLESSDAQDEKLMANLMKEKIQGKNP